MKKTISGTEGEDTTLYRYESQSLEASQAEYLTCDSLRPRHLVRNLRIEKAYKRWEMQCVEQTWKLSINAYLH
jgi:hypothetical protein